MNLNSKTLCVLPFIHKHQRLTGDNTVCCHSRIPLNGTDLIEVQSKLIRGEKPLHCHQCWDFEAQSIESPRQRENRRWLEDKDVLQYLTQYNIGDNMKTFSYDLRYSNKCNLACIGCSPQQSSLWAKELNVGFESIETNFDYSHVADAKWIYLAGGEPFLVEKMVNLLESISKQETQPSVCINTNLTVQDDRIKELCKEIKSMSLIVSIDGVGGTAEYHRWPIKWEKFNRNLEWAKSLNCSITFNTVIDAVNVAFIHEIIAYEDCTKYWSINPIVLPSALQVQNIPDHLKDFAYANFAKMKHSRYYTYDWNFKNNVDIILEKIQMKGNAEQLIEYLAILDARRNIKHYDYLGIKFE